ncbi:hypothetical protein PRIPAC_78348, partial [Pristionchus pacificus]|uniref:G protein-coupled receptor n=1 Tax=Pristionchus pacificus TaxID=54126 RepID=A0A2A6CN83_PRIPA
MESSFTALTLALGSVGVVANCTLAATIMFRTPSHMRVYSRILAASAVSDLVGVLAMMFSVTKQQIFEFACMLEFNGICTTYGIDACCAAFGVQAHIYGSTCLLLALSFAYRLSALGNAAAHKRRERVSHPNFVSIIIIGIMVIQTPLVPLFHQALARSDPALQTYRIRRGFGKQKVIGIFQVTDPFTIVIGSYSMMYSLVPFAASIVMRKMIIVKVARIQEIISATTKAQHEMLMKKFPLSFKALNLQLLVASFYFLGCNVFGLNLVTVNFFPNLPETSPLAVPICNLPNAIASIFNLYVLKPYRQALLCRGGRTAPVPQSLHWASRGSDIASAVSEVVGTRA